VGRRRKRDSRSGPSGVVIIDKPTGPTSFAVLRRVQRQLGAGKAGHAGTLDPAASGVLVGLMGEATKLSGWVTAHDKAYEAVVQLGAETDTLDAEGEVVRTAPVTSEMLEREALQAAAAGLVGTYEQVPPIFSAIKRDGRSLMSRARAGEQFEPDPRTVTCHKLEVLDIDVAASRVQLFVECAKGFYVRSLARDLGVALGTRGHLCALRRTASGQFGIGGAKSPDDIGPEDVRPMHEAVGDDVARVVLDEGDVEHIRHGRPVPRQGAAERALLLDGDGRLWAMATPSSDGTRWRVARGFNPLPSPSE